MTDGKMLWPHENFDGVLMNHNSFSITYDKTIFRFDGWTSKQFKPHRLCDIVYVTFVLLIIFWPP